MHIPRNKIRCISKLLLVLLLLIMLWYLFPTERVLYDGQVFLARDVYSQLGALSCVALPYTEPLRTLRVLAGQPTAVCFDTRWEADHWFRENIGQP